jgi:hypothetical protein
MAAEKKKVPPETVVTDQPMLVGLLVDRCGELELATSSTDKLPGVNTPWLHNLKVGRQKTTDIVALFPLLDGLGLEMVVRVKRTAARKSGGQRIAHKLRRQTERALLSQAEKAEIAQVMADMNEVASADPPPEILEARKMAAAARFERQVRPSWPR